MDKIEACMLNVDDRFKMSENDTNWFVMRGWNHNVMMPIATPLHHQEEIFFLHPHREVYVNKFFNN